MDYIQLGKDGPTVSRICFGCYPMGGPGHRGWASVDDDESIAAVYRALDYGINFFDNAALYGLGHAEQILAKALGDRRHEVIIATKCGTWRRDIWQEVHDRDSSPARIREECENSLRRLDTDYIDLYLIHWPDLNTPFELSMNTMLDLRDEGKVRYVGVSNYSVQQMKASMKAGAFTVCQPKYNMFERAAEEAIVPFCREHGIGLMGHSTLSSGLLTGKYDRSTTFPEEDWRSRYGPFRGEEFHSKLRIVEQLDEFARSYGKTVLHLAVAWSIRTVDVAIVGMKRPSQVDGGAVEAADWVLSDAEMAEIDEILSQG